MKFEDHGSCRTAGLRFEDLLVIKTGIDVDTRTRCWVA
jgi:hypothetical protein